MAKKFIYKLVVEDRFDGFSIPCDIEGLFFSTKAKAMAYALFLASFHGEVDEEKFVESDVNKVKAKHNPSCVRTYRCIELEIDAHIINPKLESRVKEMLK